MNCFARKFEAIVNQEVINQLDSWLYEPHPADLQGLNYYWENMFHHEDSITKISDVFRTFSQSFVRMGMKSLKTQATQGSNSRMCFTGGIGHIKEVTILNQHDQLSGVLALYNIELPTSDGDKRLVTMESWMAPLSHEELLNLNMTNGPQRLVGLEVFAYSKMNFLVHSENRPEQNCMVKFSRLDFSQYSMNRRAGCICDLVSKSVMSLISFGRFNTIP